MVARGRGRIINISSQLAVKGGPDIVPYVTAKAAVWGFTKALAWEATRKGVLVNAIAPGPIETDLTRARGPEWKRRMEESLPAGRLLHWKAASPPSAPTAAASTTSPAAA